MQSKLAKPNRLGVLCDCGCGVLTNENHGRISKFVRGHSARRFKIGELRDAKVADAFYCLQKKYGLSYADYHALLTAQNSVCAICKTSTPGTARGGGNERFAVDHCHATGRIRGLLCQSCNKGLGNFKDSKFAIQQAIEYLERHKVK